MQSLEEKTSLREQVQLLLEVAELGEQRTLLLLLLLLLVEGVLLQERGECEQGGEAVQGEGVEEGQLERAGLERVERCGRRIWWGGGGR